MSWPINRDNSLNLISGDSYVTSQGRNIEWTDPGVPRYWPNLSESQITLEISHGLSIAQGEAVVIGINPQVVSVSLSSEQTAILGTGIYPYSLVATFTGTGTFIGTGNTDTENQRVTLFTGLLYVTGTEKM